MTSVSRIAPSSLAIHFSSSRSAPAVSSCMSGAKVARALRSRRAATRIWWTESGRSRRTATSASSRWRTCRERTARMASTARPVGPGTGSSGTSGGSAVRGPSALAALLTELGSAPMPIEEVDDGIHRRERSRVGGIDGLDLDLAEDTDHPPVAQDGHDVVDDLDEGPALGIVQELGRALGRDGHHCPQRPLAQEGCDHLDEAAGHRADLPVVQRQAELVARGAVGARDRELHVPARVVPALAASQGDAPAEQRQVGGVVVDGPHREGLDHLDGMRNAGLGEVGQVEHPVHAELALHLPVGGRSAHVIPRIVRLGLTERSRACA